jgi:hypothetical protein
MCWFDFKTVWDSLNNLISSGFICFCGLVSSVGIATELRAGRSGGSNPGRARFSASPDRPWGPPNLLYNGYRVFHGGEVRPERAADHSPLLVPRSWKSRAIPLPTFYATTDPEMGTLYIFLICCWNKPRSVIPLQSYILPHLPLGKFSYSFSFLFALHPHPISVLLLQHFQHEDRRTFILFRIFVFWEKICIKACIMLNYL